MSFLQNYELLKKSVPVPAVDIGTRTQNCQMVDCIDACSQCQYCFNCTRLENSIYCLSCFALSKHIVDCDFCVHCELCYECLDCTECYSSTFLQNCHNCRDCHYCLLCVSCSDCFGCVGLTRKQYCIFNKQYSKEDYFKKLEELKSKKPQEILQQVEAIRKKIPHPQSHQKNNINCPYGDYIYNSKNVYWGFHCNPMENSGYIYNCGRSKNCWDCELVGTFSELCYQSVYVGQCYNCAYVLSARNCTNCFFGTLLTNCSDCWGCVGLSNKKYCILNNQLTKDEYEKAVIQIKKELGWKIG